MTVANPAKDGAPGTLSRTSRYATHLPLLRFLVEVFRPVRMIEFGMGPYSTPTLLSRGGSVLSIETDSDWMKRSQQDSRRHTVVLWPTDDVQDMLVHDANSEFDLAFVDGPVQSRVPCVNRLFGRAQLIVIHDSYTRCYRWGSLTVPAEYLRIDYCVLQPETSVFASRVEDVDMILQCPGCLART